MISQAIFYENQLVIYIVYGHYVETVNVQKVKKSSYSKAAAALIKL